MMQTAYAKEERYGWSISFCHIAKRIRAADFVAWAIFSLDQRSLRHIDAIELGHISRDYVPGGRRC
jgi:hypothetical protein